MAGTRDGTGTDPDPRDNILEGLAKALDQDAGKRDFKDLFDAFESVTDPTENEFIGCLKMLLTSPSIMTPAYEPVMTSFMSWIA